MCHGGFASVLFTFTPTSRENLRAILRLRTEILRCARYLRVTSPYFDRRYLPPTYSTRMVSIAENSPRRPPARSTSYVPPWDANAVAAAWESYAEPLLRK